MAMPPFWFFSPPILCTGQAPDAWVFEPSALEDAPSLALEDPGLAAVFGVLSAFLPSVFDTVLLIFDVPD